MKNKLSLAAAGCLLLLSGLTLAQDAMKYGVKHLTVMAEDDKVRVLHYTAKSGDKTPMHSHPATVVYVVKGGKARFTFPDGTVKESESKSGEVQLRAPVTHADEALTDIESILIELKK